MKLKNHTEEQCNIYTPILSESSTKNSSKCHRTKLFAAITILLSTAVLVWLYVFHPKCVGFNENQSSDIQVSTSYLNWKIIANSKLEADNYCSVTSDDYKFDCFPRGKADQKSCEERNCCWSPSSSNSQVPWCYYPSNYSNYKFINVTKSRNEIIAFFNLTSNTNYKDNVKILCMDISLQTAQRLRIKVNISQNDVINCLHF